MTTIRAACLALALSIFCALSAAPALADEAASIYDPGKVVFIELTLAEAEETKLEAEPSKYVKGTFSLSRSSDGTPTGTKEAVVPSRPVEVRLKGNVGGSFRHLNEKAGFKLKFKAENAVLGLRKMTLNNMVQDPSMIHETLAYAAFRAAGVPASRTGYAYVRLNGHDIGVYLDLENLDEVGLARIFGSFDKSTQHLYEGEDGHDVVPGEASEFEVDEGPKDITDLEDLIEVVNGEPGEGESWSKHVAAKADLAEMTTMWAVEKYIDHWDGYSGHAIPGERPNNYYLYSEPSGRFQMLPWGADQTWIPTIGVETPGREVTFDGEGGALFNKCLEDEACFRAYWEALKSVRDAIAGLGPVAMAEATVAMLAPWQHEEEEHGRFEYDAAEIKEDKYGVDTTLQFIAGRQAEADAWLAANKPPEPHPEPESALIVDKGSPGPTPPSGVANPTINFERAKREGRRLTTQVRVGAPGEIRLRATFGFGKKRKRACAGAKRVLAAGDVTIRCNLSDAASERLAHGSLRLWLTITLISADGSKRADHQKLQLMRD